MATLIASYTSSNTDGSFGVGDIIRHSQSFTNLSSDYNLSSCIFKLQRVSGTAGTVVAKLYTHTGTYGSSSLPTGTALATSNSINVSALSTTFSDVTFTFGTAYKMIAGTYYVITIEYSGGGAGDYHLIKYYNGSGGAFSGNKGK